MNGLTGMEKFSHLEDKIYLTIEFVKKLKDEKERLERQLAERTRRDEERIRVAAIREIEEERLKEEERRRHAMELAHLRYPGQFADPLLKSGLGSLLGTQPGFGTRCLVSHRFVAAQTTGG